MHRALAEADTRLFVVVQAVWRELTAALAAQQALIERVTARPPGISSGEHRTTEARDNLETGVTQEMVGVLDELRAARPIERVIAAMENWDREASQWVRTLPEQAVLSGVQVRALARVSEARLGWRVLAGLEPRQRTLALRRLLGASYYAASVSRARRDGLMLQTLARTLRAVSLQYEVAYRLLNSADQSASEQFRQRRQAVMEALLQQGPGLIAQRQQWRESELVPRSLRDVAAAIVGIGARPPERTVDRSGFLAHWTQQVRAVQDEMGLARQATRLAVEVATLLQRSLDACFAERERLSGDLAAAAAAFERKDLENDPLKALLVAQPVPATARVREIGTGLRAILQSLPEAVELPDSFPPLPSSRKARRVAPRRKVLEAFDLRVAPELQTLFAELEEEHSDVVRDLERARAVVAFGVSSTAKSRGEAQERIAEEARQNARSLLTHRRESLGDRRSQLERRLRGLAQRALEPLHEAISPDRYNLALRRRRERLRAQSGSLGARLLDSLWGGLTVVASRAAAVVDRLLIHIGWRAEPIRERSEVVRRPTLPAALAGDDDGKSISELYAHLFRQDPVEESQFLVGREPELDAIAEARARWEAGHAAAVLVVGERGSGKTSLLNCALLGPLAGIAVVRTEFRERITTPEALRTFLRAQVGAREGVKLEAFLAEERRVIVLEEVERSFLRQIGQYEAVRELQRIITATSRTTLWLLVVNGIAFRLLDPAVRFGEVFSHRIDASSATAQELQAAILFRHNLSGLRVHYDVAQEDGLVARARSAFGRQNAEQDFFKGLALLSDRVYRTAFSLWLRHIKPNADGSITVRRVDNSGADAVVAGLGHVHLFTLLAVLQHGSLTPEEHAAVFALPLDESRSQLNDLLARELLGPEDGRPGYRVRAEALPIVRQALYRRNLL